MRRRRCRRAGRSRSAAPGRPGATSSGRPGSRTLVPSSSTTWQSTRLPRNVRSATLPSKDPHRRVPGARAIPRQPEALGPDRHLHGRARRERAAQRDRNGLAARHRDQALAGVRADDPPGQEVDQAHEVRHLAAGGSRVDLAGRAGLEEHAALENGDPVGERHRLRLIVGDVHEGDAGPSLEVLQLPAHPLAELRVEVRQGLVQEKDPGLDHQAPGQRHPLLLASRQLAREAPLETGEVHQLEHAGDSRPDVRPWHPPDLQTEGDVLVHGLVGPDRVVLEHHAHPSPLRRDDGLRRGDGPAVHSDGPGVGREEARDEPEERGLAAAARAQQRQELAVPDLEAQVAHGHHAVVPLRHAVDRDAGHRAP